MASKFGTRPKLNTEGQTVDVEIIDKTNDEVVDSHSFALAEIHNDLKVSTALYGLSKLLQDRSSDTPTGPEKLDAMKGVMAQLTAGTWAKERKVGAPVVSAEVEALARLKSCTVAQAQKALSSYSKEARRDILANPAIAELAATIRAERSEGDGVDLSDLA